MSVTRSTVKGKTLVLNKFCTATIFFSTGIPKFRKTSNASEESDKDLKTWRISFSTLSESSEDAIISTNSFEKVSTDTVIATSYPL